MYREQRVRGRSASADQGLVRAPPALPMVGLEGRVGGAAGRLAPIVGGKGFKEEEKEAGEGSAAGFDRIRAHGRAVLTPLQRNVHERLANLEVHTASDDSR